MIFDKIIYKIIGCYFSSFCTFRLNVPINSVLSCKSISCQEKYSAILFVNLLGCQWTFLAKLLWYLFGKKNYQSSLFFVRSQTVPPCHELFDRMI